MKLAAVGLVGVLALTACSAGQTSDSNGIDQLCGTLMAVAGPFAARISSYPSDDKDNRAQVFIAYASAMKDLAASEWPNASDPDLKSVLHNIARNDDFVADMRSVVALCTSATT